MSYAYALGQTSIILRVRFRDSTTGLPKTGISGSSSGLIISSIADVEAAVTAYTQAASHIQTIATLGTYAAPSASSCRLGEVDSTNDPGLYELQLANARFAVASSKSLVVSWSGAGVLGDGVHIPLTSIDPYNVLSLWTTALVESYAAQGAAPTPAQALQFLVQEKQNWSYVGTAKNVKKLDGSTTAAIMTLDSSSTPTLGNRTS